MNVKINTQLIAMILAVSMLITACNTNTDSPQATTDELTISTLKTTQTELDNEDDTQTSEEAEGNNTGGEQSQPSQDRETITVEWLYPLSGEYLQAIDDLNGSYVIQEISELYNIQFDFIHFATGQETEQFNLMVGTNDLPDVITHDAGIPRYPGGGDKAIEDGNYLRMNELIEESAPVFHELISSDAELYKDIVTDEGNIWGMPMIDLDPQDSFVGPIIRQDWLDDLGLESPTTIDDWTDVLTKFKEEKGAESPFIINSQGLHADHAFIGAYGINNDMYQVDGEVRFGPIQPEYKDYLAQMREWFEAGLLDPNFPSNDDHVSMFITGKSGAGTQGFWVFESWEAASEDPNIKIAGVQYPVLNEGETAHFRQNNSRMRGYHTSVTTVAEHPERIVEMLDYLYTDEGFLLANYGIEGETYIMEDDQPIYTDKMIQNEEGVPMNVAFVKYAFSHGSFLRDWHREDTLFSQDSLDACELWQSTADADYMIPSAISLTAEEGDELSRIMSDIHTFVNEKRMAYIMGNESLDTFDDSVEQVMKMDIEDAIELQQKALDRYNAK